jgi:hypothetical protein
MKTTTKTNLFLVIDLLNSKEKTTDDVSLRGSKAVYLRLIRDFLSLIFSCVVIGIALYIDQSSDLSIILDLSMVSPIERHIVFEQIFEKTKRKIVSSSSE